MVGYTGGTEPNPTYANILDSTEALLIEFDPNIINYSEVLAVSQKLHNPFVKPRKRQYRSAIWIQSQQQRIAALSHVDKLLSSKKQHSFGFFHPKKKKKKKNKPSQRQVYMDVEDVRPFYLAEEYHQDFIDKHGAIFD